MLSTAVEVCVCRDLTVSGRLAVGSSSVVMRPWVSMVSLPMFLNPVPVWEMMTGLPWRLVCW